MIKTLRTNTPYLTTNSFSPYISGYNTNAPGYGYLKFDFISQSLQVYDGSQWQTLSKDVDIGFDPMMTNIIIWAQNKMMEEQQLQEKLKKFPALAKAHENYEIIKALVDNYKDSNE